MIYSTFGKCTTLFLSLTLLMSSSLLEAQYALDTYYNDGDLLYEDHIYQDGIRTVRLTPANNPTGVPVIALNSSERLKLTFDDLYGDFINYSYTIYHCDADWTPSDLTTNDYLGSLTNDYIQDYDYSVNALIPYTHYRLTFPNNNLRLKKSGNYLLVVYRDDDESNLVLSRRFMVYEEMVGVGTNVRRPRQVDLMDTHQQINFTISHSNYPIQNPFSDLKVHLMQNFRFDNAITNLKPRFVRNNELVYDYDQGNNFPGINEFRFFDIKNLLTLTQNVRRIKRDSSYFTVFLKEDQSRAISNYTLWEDINGKYVVRRMDVRDSDSEADYALVDFILNKPKPLSEGDVYIFGQLSDWKLRPEFKMKYNYDRNAYQAQAVLKQGYYNYCYATTAPDSSDLVDIASLEGSHWQTGNVYHIFVYNREVGSRYDRLVGFASFSSNDLF